MSKKLKVMQARRQAILAAIRQHPGITTKELVDATGAANTKLVSNAMWRLLRAGNVLSEAVTRNGAHMNAYYLPEQIDAESVERVRQTLVVASDVVPVERGTLPSGSVFEMAGKERARHRRAARTSRASVAAASTTPPASGDAPRAQASPAPLAPASSAAISDFACAIANDGSLVPDPCRSHRTRTVGCRHGDAAALSRQARRRQSVRWPDPGRLKACLPLRTPDAWAGTPPR